MTVPTLPLRVTVLVLATITGALPLAAQDPMVGTRWSVHQQDRDSGVAWLFLDGGTLRVIARGDSTSADHWQWKADSLEISLTGHGTFVGMLVGPRLAGTRDEGKPDEGWWYADQIGGPNVTPEGLTDTVAAADSAPAGPAVARRFRRRRGAALRGRGGTGSASGGSGAGFWGSWADGVRLGVQFSLDGGVVYGWVSADGAVTRGRGRWQRVQRGIVVRIKEAGGADLVLRGELTLRAFVGRATHEDGTSTAVVLQRRVGGGAVLTAPDSVAH